MFKYPCKFIPEIPKWAIRNYLKSKKGTVLDSFAGSGTTVLEAVLNGYEAYSTEIDDVAKLITKVKTTKLTQKEFNLLDIIYISIINGIDNEKLIIEIPEIYNLTHWFPEQTIKELARMKKIIDGTKEENIRNFFYVCFVSIIKKVSFADNTSPKPYVSNKIIKTPPAVKKEFLNVYERYKKMEYELMSINTPLGKSVILPGDALDFYVDKKIDLAITSPPYINAFDYGRTMRLENIWLGLLTENELQIKKKKYIGTEKIISKDEQKNLTVLNHSALLKSIYYKIEGVDKKRALIVKKFFEDIEKNLLQVYNVLKKNGKYMIVIGNSSIRKINIENWKIIEELAYNNGYETETFFNYIIKNPYIRIPRQGQGGKISRDYILVLKKVNKDDSER